MKIIEGVIFSDDMTVLCQCPNEMKGMFVVPEGTQAILQDAFNGCLIDTVVLPNTLKRIGEKAFANCKMLKGIKLPEGLEYMGKNVFNNCIALQYAITPCSLKSIKNGAFAGCMSLKEVSFPESGLESIEDNSFKGCFSLEKIIIPASVTNMGKAFMDCWKLSRVIVRSSKIDVNRRAFEGCSEKINIVKTFTIKGFFRNNNQGQQRKSKAIRIKKRQFSRRIKNGLILRLPDKVVRIDEYAFYNSPGLNEIYIPGTVDKISKFAFAGCSGLSLLEIAEGVKFIEKAAFKDCVSLTSIVLPDSIVEVDAEAFAGCSSLRQFSISRHTVLSEDAFNGTSKELQVTCRDNKELSVEQKLLS